jgi:hypothetical protein
MAVRWGDAGYWMLDAPSNFKEWLFNQTPIQYQASRFGIQSLPKLFKILPQLFKILFVKREDIISALFAANDQLALGQQFNVM